MEKREMGPWARKIDAANRRMQSAVWAHPRAADEAESAYFATLAEVDALAARLEVAERAKAEVLRDYGTLYAEAARIEAQRDEARARIAALEAALRNAIRALKEDRIPQGGDFVGDLERVLSAAPAAGQGETGGGHA